MKYHQKLRVFLQEIPYNSELHKPFWRLCGSKRIVLFLHGIQGSPSQFDWLVNVLPEDTDYISLLLPGHGSTAADFRQNGSDEWLTSVWTLLDCILPIYEQIDLVGHSMGCLIWLLAHQKYPGCFHGSLFLSCPFVLRPTLRYVRNNLLALSDKPSNNVYVQAGRDANSLLSRNPLDYLFCFKPYFDLLRLIRTANALQGLKINNGYAFLGLKDEIVSQKSTRKTCQMSLQTITLPQCGHNYFTPRAKETVQENFLRMISLSK